MDKNKAIIFGGIVIAVSLLVSLIYVISGLTVRPYTVTIINNCVPMACPGPLTAKVIYTDPYGNVKSITLNAGQTAVLQVKPDSVLSIYTWSSLEGNLTMELSTQEEILSNNETVYVCTNCHGGPSRMPGPLP